MASRRRSLAHEVIGLQASYLVELKEHDETFFAPVSDSSDDSETEFAPLSCPDEVSSDEEENLEDLDNGVTRVRTGNPVTLQEKRTHSGEEAASTTLAVVASKIEEGCGCSGKNCFNLVSPDVILGYRKMCESLGREQLELYLAGKLDVLAKRGAVEHARADTPPPRARTSYAYAVDGTSVCKTVFLYVHSATRHVLKKVQSHLEAAIVTAPPHGNAGAVPWHALTCDDIQMVKSFIYKYASIQGLPEPAAPRGHNGPAPTYLPCSTSKVLLHSQYVKAGGSVAYRTFAKIWADQCPDVIIMQPKEDVCARCSDLQADIHRARTEEDRLKASDALVEHMRRATEARDRYRASIQRARDSERESDGTPQYQHYTLDFAQQVMIPHHAREVGPLYFKIPRRIQIFGIACESKPQQVNYLTDEHQTIGKDSSKSHGPNSVLSMLHHHLENYGSEEPHLGLQADNCCGQNKNRSVIAYLAWRVIVGLNKSIKLAFMRVGHTRCFVDWGFGFIKMKFRRNDVDTLAQLKDVVHGSVDFNVGVTYSWVWRMWDKFMARYFLPMRNITQYQVFQFDSDHPGEVHISSSDTFPNTTIKILLPSVNIDELSVDHLPEIIPPAGISLARAQYVFKQVRPHCYEESRDATCPHPASIDYLVRDEQEAEQAQDQ